MSTTATSATHPQPAPWKPTFQSHISKMDSPEFVFSTLTPAPSGAPTDFLPRARYCIFRSFWAELPENKHNNAPQNERVYESDLLCFTTDDRMNKTFEIFGSSKGKADDESLTKGSGGGGPCEAVFWVKEEKVQWRVQGRAFIVGPDVEGSGDESSGVRTVKSELGKRMRVVKEEGKEGWSWLKEVTGHFGNISPGMRGSFKQPPPGQPVDQPYDDKKLALGEKVEDLEDATAREHFRVVVITPDYVESVDLSDPNTSRRQAYTYDAAKGEWTHRECWP